MRKTRIIIVDDHPLLRDALNRLLSEEPDMEVIGEAADGEAAVKIVTEMKPDIVVMDVGLPKLSGVEATKRIKALCPKVAVLVLTVHDDEEYIISLLEAGAAGYLLKTSSMDDIVRSIGALAAGEMVLNPEIGRKLLKLCAARTPKPPVVTLEEELTGRELEVLRLVARGLPNRAIARELKVTLHTVKGYLAEIFSKMMVHSRVEAALLAVKAGLLSPDELA